MSQISAFADDLLWRMLALSPDMAAELGLTDVDGRALPAAGLVDFSDAGAKMGIVTTEKIIKSDEEWKRQLTPE